MNRSLIAKNIISDILQASIKYFLWFIGQDLEMFVKHLNAQYLITLYKNK